MFHRPLTRQFSLVVFIAMGLVLQAQSVWACQLMDGASSVICCCDEGKSELCDRGGDCDQLNTTEVSAGESCCDVSAQHISAVASHQTTPNIQVVLLNGPQPPPPIPSSIPLLDSTPAAQALLFEYFPTLPVDPPRYLITQRIRL